ncbi:MAG: hypothetical protein K2N87_05645 [Eubacterium sp.]|nr:hypothetical protein [Eubacterium sp.]
MQVFFSVSILLLSMLAYCLLGKAFCIKCRFRPAVPEIFCIGFFLYFAAFQIVAEAMILTKQRLHVLGAVWLVLLTAGVAAAAWIVRQDAQPDKSRLSHQKAAGGGSRLAGAGRLLFALMGAAVVCECATAVLMQRRIGWDFAYYIGNMATSVATDTMYIYDGSSGLLRSHLELRYALSSFYMNTAWISQITGISALVLQKYVAGVLCVLLTNAVVYSFAMEVFHRDQKKAAVLVTITIVLTIFWDVYDTTAQFLLLRNYEAKSYCANVVLPMACYLLYRLWKNSAEEHSWKELFLVAFASVAVSMSSLVLVPALIGLMLLAHLLVERRWDGALALRGICCMMPNVCYLVVYLAFTRGLLVVEV